MAIRITCINKSQGWHQDPHHAIATLGRLNEGNGQSGRSSRLDVYDFLKNQGGQAYVTGYGGIRASVYPRENQHGTRYVQTYADNVWTDNLLSLPECN